MTQKRINELNNNVLNSDLLKARFEVTKFYDKLNKEDKEECIKALRYAGSPIKELNKMFIKPIKHLRQVNYNVPQSAPKQRKPLLDRIILNPMSIALCVYLGITLMIVLLTIKL